MAYFGAGSGGSGGGGSSAGLIFTLMVITSASYTATDLPVTS